MLVTILARNAAAAPLVAVLLFPNLILSLLAPASAQAQCAFNHSPKAKTVKLALVRATEPCLAPNVSTNDGLAACSPPMMPSAYSFADSGSTCEMRVVHKPSTSCGINASCSEMTFSAKCSGILDATATPIDGEGSWSLRVSLRITGNDDANGDMTIIDFPMQILFPPAQHGNLAIKVSDTTYGVTGDFEYPECANVDLVERTFTANRDVIAATILDPDGNAFATTGTAGSAEGSASCGIDLAQKTKGIKGSLVRGFDACPYTSFPAPNSSTGDGVPSCAPPYAISSNRYDEKTGACKIAIAQKLGDCAQACAPMSIGLDCKGVTLANGTPSDESGWKLLFKVRASTTDASAGDATVVDLPVELDLPAFAGGKLKFRSLAHDLEAAIPPPNTLELIGCTSVEVIDVKVLDASGNEFARLGTASFPH